LSAAVLLPFALLIFLLLPLLFHFTDYNVAICQKVTACNDHLAIFQLISPAALTLHVSIITQQNGGKEVITFSSMAVKAYRYLISHVIGMTKPIVTCNSPFPVLLSEHHAIKAYWGVEI
jgi:predicted membrane channel-forming protein YqfA (hemolysin III family)